MLALIQSNFFSGYNEGKLCRALDRFRIHYEFVYFRNGVLCFKDTGGIVSLRDMDVMVWGGQKLLECGLKRNWKYVQMFTDTYRHRIQQFGDLMLNSDGVICHFNAPLSVKYPKFFARPLADTKLFNGGVYTTFQFTQLQSAVLNKKGAVTEEILISSLKPVQKEYRFFVANNRIIDTCVYRVNGYPMCMSTEQVAYDFVSDVLRSSGLNGCFVLDACSLPYGYRIVEFNNFFSSSFYACDVQRVVNSALSV